VPGAPIGWKQCPRCATTLSPGVELCPRCGTAATDPSEPKQPAKLIEVPDPETPVTIPERMKKAVTTRPDSPRTFTPSHAQTQPSASAPFINPTSDHTVPIESLKVTPAGEGQRMIEVAPRDDLTVRVEPLEVQPPDDATRRVPPLPPTIAPVGAAELASITLPDSSGSKPMLPGLQPPPPPPPSVADLAPVPPPAPPQASTMSLPPMASTHSLPHLGSTSSLPPMASTTTLPPVGRPPGVDPDQPSTTSLPPLDAGQPAAGRPLPIEEETRLRPWPSGTPAAAQSRPVRVTEPPRAPIWPAITFAVLGLATVVLLLLLLRKQ